MKRINWKMIVLLFFIPLVFSLFFMIFFHREPLSSDGKEYDTLARNIISGKGYSLDGKTPYAFRPPLYSVFVALIYLFSKCSPIAVILVQVMIVSCIPFLFYKILNSAGFDQIESFYSSLIVAIYPFGYIYVQQLVTEPLTTFLFMVASLLAVKIWLENNCNFIHFLLCGIAITLPALSKSQHISLIVALIISLAGKGLFQKNLIQTTKKKIIPLLLGFFIIMSPWAVRNYHHFQRTAILGEGAFGELLLKGVYETEGKWFLMTFWNEKSSGHLKSFQEWQAKELSACDLSEKEGISIGKAKAKIAIEKMRKEPIEEIRGYFVRLYSFWIMIPTDQSLKTKVITIFLDLGLLVTSVIGLILYFKKIVVKLFPIYLCIFVENVILAVGHIEARYSISLKPFILVGLGLLLANVYSGCSRKEGKASG